VPDKRGLMPGKGWTSVPDKGPVPGNGANINMFDSSLKISGKNIFIWNWI